MKSILTIILISLFSLFSSCRELTSKNNDAHITEKKNEPSVSADFDQSSEPEKMTNSCSYENKTYTLGIGLYKPLEKFKIYNNKSLTEIFSDISIYENGNEANFCSKFYKPDYGIMSFICIDSLDNSYKIIVNESDEKYISKKEKGRFQSWQDHILNSMGISSKYPSKLAIKDKPNSKAITIDSTETRKSYCPITFNGDWLKVSYSCTYKENGSVEECSSIISCDKSGWIRWKEKNYLLIDIYLIP